MDQLKTTLDADGSSPQPMSSEGLMAIRRTVGWIRFIAVLGIIGAVLGIIVGLSMLAGDGSYATSAEGFALPKGFFMVYVVTGAVGIWVAAMLMQYANNLSKYATSGTTADIDQALKKQRQYWMLLGILAIASIVLAVVIGIVAAAVIAEGITNE